MTDEKLNELLKLAEAAEQEELQPGSSWPANDKLQDAVDGPTVIWLIRRIEELERCGPIGC